MFEETDMGQDSENTNSKVAKLDTSTSNEICDNIPNEEASTKTAPVNDNNDNASAENSNGEKKKKKRKKNKKAPQENSHENKREDVQSQSKLNLPTANKTPSVVNKQNPPIKMQQKPPTSNANQPLGHQNKYKKNKNKIKFNKVDDSRLLAYGLNPNKVEREKKNDKLYRKPKS